MTASVALGMDGCVEASDVQVGMCGTDDSRRIGRQGNPNTTHGTAILCRSGQGWLVLGVNGAAVLWQSHGVFG